MANGSQPAPAQSRMVELDNGAEVKQSEYEAVIAVISAFIPTMLPGHSYTVETMAGQALWRTHWRRNAGPIVAHAVRRGFLPLQFAENGRRSTKSYELAATE